jgi:predicted metal-dependent hydrolase
MDPDHKRQSGGFLDLAGGRIPIGLVKSPRARRYLLRVRADGSARVTIPRGGSVREALLFAERNKAWLERQLQMQAACPKRLREWLIGTEIFFQGLPVKIEAGANGENGMIRFGSEVVMVTDPAGDLRPAIAGHLWGMAARELPPRVFEFAALHQFPARRVTVRNQRSRWGSCSRRGTISLNWRLIQTPRHVQDYIVLHELCHLRQMNHSARFWREVERVCPDFAAAEQWLKQHSLLMS